MDNLTIYFVLFTSFCFKDVWSKIHDHEFLKEVGVENRIRGGEETTIEEHPYIAYLVPQGSSGPLQVCSGAIISPRNILTSAQCIDNAKSIDIRVGSTDRTSGGQEYSTTVFMAHPMYLEGERDYDVGVLVIPEGMEVDGNTVDIIDVVDIDDDPTSGDKVTISGWGKVGPKLFDILSINLKEAELSVISRGQCESEGSGITDRLFCAIDEDGTDAACAGDFGDPAVNEDGLLAGVVSRTTKCDPSKPQPITRFGEPTIRAFIMAMTTE